MTTLEKITIGTRGSPLALKQTDMVIEALQRAYPALQCEVKVIQTSGDWKPEDGDTPLPPIEGGKAQFAKEIEQALLAGVIDCGVHSAKDIPAVLPEGLSMEHYLPRADARDAFLCNGQASVEGLKQGAVVGTCSPRRGAILKHARPDLEIAPLRGNVHTRIRKLCAGQVDVTILALAGLDRLGLDQGTEHGTVTPIPVEIMLPACGQGAIGIEIREDRQDMKPLLAAINCPATSLCLTAERAVVRIMEGSCHTAIGAYATWDGKEMHLHALIVAPDGSALFSEEFQGPVQNEQEAAAIGADVGQRLKDKTPENLL
jgi:hydroxymethylbilane synthase